MERQKVITCLKVFSDETASALINHPKLFGMEGISDTTDFIKIVLGWWKIVSTHVAGAHKALNDPLKAEIRECSDQWLQTIKTFGNLALKMSCQHGLRIKQLTRDTGNCIYHTFCGVAELC